MKLSENKATLSFANGKQPIELPVYEGAIGPDVIDIRKLYGQTGMFTYDPGQRDTKRRLQQKALLAQHPRTLRREHQPRHACRYRIYP